VDISISLRSVAHSGKMAGCIRHGMNDGKSEDSADDSFSYKSLSSIISWKCIPASCGVEIDDCVVYVFVGSMGSSSAQSKLWDGVLHDSI
jgi:hypothetical protein